MVGSSFLGEKNRSIMPVIVQSMGIDEYDIVIIEF